MNNKSFSLIELLVVIIIVGVLAGVIIISTSSAIGKTKLAKAQAFYSNSSKELVTKIIAEWSFDEDVSPYTTAKDTASGNNGAVFGAIYKDSNSKECLSGGCFLFNGNAYIDCGGTNKLDIQDDLSIFVWVKVSSDVGTVRIGNIIGNYSYSPNFNFEALSYGKTRVYWNNGERDISSTDFDMRDDTWHYVGFTRSLDKNIIRMYTDGSLNNSTTAATTKTFYWPLRIGGDFRATPGIPFHGMIDEVRIYKRALTVSEIKQEYLAGLNSLLSQGSISEKDYNNRISNLAINN